MPDLSEAEEALATLNEKLKNLKNKRAFLKRSLTILQQYLDGSNERPDYLNKIVGQFAVCERSVSTCNEMIESIYDTEYEAKFNDVFYEKEITDSIFAELKSKVELLVSPGSVNQTPTINQPVSHSTIKLPLTELPTFSGKFDEWLTFRERFKSLIDSNKSLANIDKMQYLVSALKGEAAEAVKHLEITNENYEKTKELLKDRFENKRVIITHHIRALFELAAITKESYHEFRNLLNAITQHTHSLNVMGRKVDNDDLLVYLIVSKLPLHTRKEWEDKLPNSDLPTYKGIIDFLTHKCHTLGALQVKDAPEVTYKISKTKSKLASCNLAANRVTACRVCEQGNHFTNQCPKLLNLSIKERIDKARSKNLCLNCLRQGHLSKNCNSSRCKKCSGLHNTILHIENSPRQEPSQGSSDSTNIAPAASLHALKAHEEPSNIILSTCVLEIRDSYGNYHNARALLDSGSQINIISKKLWQLLELPTRATNLPIVGISNNCTNANLVSNANIKSKFHNFNMNLEFYILENITTNVPVNSINANTINLPKNIQLADPHFYKSRSVDLLIGAQVFFQLLCIGQIRTNQPSLILQKSVFGWILAGAVSNKSITARSAVSCNLNLLQNLNENISENKENSNEEIACENHFMQTIKRDTSGRFVASLPWKSDPSLLGNSLEIARRRFINLERKLLKNPDAKTEYDVFMNEYLKLGHMKEINTIENAQDTGYFLPHHAVYKAESITTKTRVVFDASCKSSSGYSLNDVLMVGPVIQDDLFSILIRFRFYKYVLSADISKMYRQILINPNDTWYQKILYRFTPDEPIRVYELKTLTYGTRPASFIATRCLKQLAFQTENTNPSLSKTIARDFYMDDLITGGDNENDLISLRNDITAVLATAGFPLRKWASNNKIILDGLESQQTNLVLECKESDTLKTLGICWSPVPDTIEYKSNLNSDSSRITKRLILSHIAQIFDPLGLLGPVIVIAKIIMQELWKLKLSWDESIPSDIFTRWKKVANELRDISELSIPRKLVNCKNSQLELHGFADASEYAYGACIYLREIKADNSINCCIICSKSRIAPLQTLSIPRLELCAALLLTELMRKVISAAEGAPEFSFFRVNYYSDSTITLSWIHSCPSRWKSFVATRIAKIHKNSNPDSWFYVSSLENPADVISRGAFPKQLARNNLWWSGPEFLRDFKFFPKHFKSGPDCVPPEAKVLIAQQPEQNIDKGSDRPEEFEHFIFSKYSNFSKLIRIIAQCKRFITLCKNKTLRYSSEITADEIKNAEISLVKLVQGIHFHSDIKLLSSSRDVDKNSKIRSLSPFLDCNQILRVGGRLRNTELPFETKHPILLPKGLFCDLIIKNIHERSLHSGIQGTLAAIRLHYWPISGKSTVRKVLRKCLRCFKNNPRNNEPKMGDLPASRVKMARPFSNVGIDYFGPFYLKEGSRKSRFTRAYGCLFVCMPTKAVHCELVENLSTEAFIAALKRFVSRRGLPAEIFCDNATNFVGAANEMREIIKFLSNTETQNTISKEMATRGIKWTFNIPRAPHMGGLWEAAVKSFKRHIYKTVGNAHLTFCEMYTLLTEVECILNSRPLIPLSEDPNDLTYLTPGHFLIGDHLKSLPEVDLCTERINKLSRWQYTQRLQQEFWRKWSRDYLQELQRRQKWRVSEGPTLRPGDLVLISEDNVPSRAWKLGRIMETYPGADGVVRSASVKTVGGLFKRPAARLCLLPSAV